VETFGDALGVAAPLCGLWVVAGDFGQGSHEVHGFGLSPAVADAGEQGQAAGAVVAELGQVALEEGAAGEDEVAGGDAPVVVEGLEFGEGVVEAVFAVLLVGVAELGVGEEPAGAGEVGGVG